MDLGDLTLFNAAKKRLSWLTQRQEILSQNIANADTPGYRAKDLRPYSFRELLRRESAQLNLEVRDGGHVGGRRRRIRDFLVDNIGRPYETAPGKNSVVLEEQMAKTNATNFQHQMTNQLYKKHLGMIKIAIGRGG